MFQFSQRVSLHAEVCLVCCINVTAELQRTVWNNFASTVDTSYSNDIRERDFTLDLLYVILCILYANGVRFCNFPNFFLWTKHELRCLTNKIIHKACLCDLLNYIHGIFRMYFTKISGPITRSRYRLGRSNHRKFHFGAQFLKERGNIIVSSCFDE